MKARAALIALALVGCTSQRARMDLNHVCQAAEKAIQATESQRQAEIFYGELEKYWFKSNVKTGLDAIAMADPAQRYELLRQAAEDLGVRDWHCPALRQLWPEPSTSTSAPAN